MKIYGISYEIHILKTKTKNETDYRNREYNKRKFVCIYAVHVIAFW